VRIGLEKSKIELILILNKVDLVEPKEILLEVTREYVSLINGIKLGPEKAHLAQLDTTVFMISSLHNDGVIDIKNYLISIAPMRPWIIDKKQGITDMSDEDRVEEMVLEALMENTHDEIPYIADINCKSIKQIHENQLRIEVDIAVESNSQQKIIIGQQGRTLVSIRQSAVEQLEKIFKKEIILFLWIVLNPRARGSGA
jgi:GTP-binding protein Era